MLHLLSSRCTKHSQVLQLLSFGLEPRGFIWLLNKLSSCSLCLECLSCCHVDIMHTDVVLKPRHTIVVDHFVHCNWAVTCSAGPRGERLPTASVARAHGKSGHMEECRPGPHSVSFYSAQGALLATSSHLDLKKKKDGFISNLLFPCH